MVDRLEGLLGHFSVSARTFQAGPLCGINTLDGSLPYGQLHLLRQGEAEVCMAPRARIGSLGRPCCSIRAPSRTVS